VADSVERYLARLFARLSRSIGRQAAEEHVKELRAHIEMSVAEMVRNGLTEEDAVAKALRQVGSVRRVADGLLRAHFQGSRLRRAALVLLGVLGGSTMSFCLSSLFWVATGGSAAALAFPLYWLTMVGFIAVFYGGPGLLLRRPALVGIVFGVLLGLHYGWLALHGGSHWIGWARGGFVFLVQPIANGLLLAWYLKMLDKRTLLAAGGR